MSSMPHASGSKRSMAHVHRQDVPCLRKEVKRSQPQNRQHSIRLSGGAVAEEEDRPVVTYSHVFVKRPTPRVVRLRRHGQRHGEHTVVDVHVGPWVGVIVFEERHGVRAKDGRGAHNFGEEVVQEREQGVFQFCVDVG